MINIPNTITFMRIVGSLCLMLLDPFSIPFYVIYTLSGCSDVLDGWIARKLKSTSSFGAMLDSVADLVFYGVMLIKLLPVLWQIIPSILWYIVIFILLLRLVSYFIAAMKYQRFSSLHTYLNKLTGAALFFIPYVISTPWIVPVCGIICIIAAAASGEELWIHLHAQTYDANTKTMMRKKR